uniref:Uncharacterized protein n=1 Tax=Arundo donax TaxID=35708 RepID=A0A0A9AE13_ARUDO
MGKYSVTKKRKGTVLKKKKVTVPSCKKKGGTVLTSTKINEVSSISYNN